MGTDPTNGSPITVREAGPVTITIFDGEQLEADVDAYLEGLRELHDRDRPYIGASLMLRYSAAPGQLRRVGEWMREHKDDVARLCVGSAIIAPRVGFRFVLSSLFMIQRMPMPYTVVSGSREAAEWIELRARSVDLRVPDDLAAVLAEELRGRGYDGA
ncbi:MAG: hypothetical protein RLO52_44835 [Sandaracinaceae bacterium]